MSIFRRAPADPELEAARAAAQREQAQFELERARVEAQLAREQQEAQAEFDRRQAIAEEQEKRRRDAARRAERAERRERNRKARAEFMAKLRPVLPLLLINGGAAYAQAAYAYEQIAPAAWNTPSRVAFAVAFSAALESIAVYVQWHAHDALLLKAHATAASLRRSAWVIAAVVAAINYAHFAGDGMAPTSAAVAFALLSLLSPWLWGLHTRRAQHVQLLAEDANLIDEGGVEFSPQRRRAFPWRSWQAKRWSIDHGVRDPRAAWEGYNAERLARKAERAAAARAKAAEKPAKRPATDTPPAGGLTAIVDATAPSAGTPIDGQPTVVYTVTDTTSDPSRASVKTTIRRPVRTPSGRRQMTAAEKVAAAVTKLGADASLSTLMKEAGVSESSVLRHRPKQTATVNGHDHSKEG